MHAFAWRCWWTLLVWTIAEWVKESQIEPHRESKPKQKILNQYLPLIISIWKRAIDVRVSIRSNKFQKGKKKWENHPSESSFSKNSFNQREFRFFISIAYHFRPNLFFRIIIILYLWRARISTEANGFEKYIKCP